MHGLNELQTWCFEMMQHQGVPDEWAYIIASKVTDEKYRHYFESASEILLWGVGWWSQLPEGEEFWNSLHDALVDEEFVL